MSQAEPIRTEVRGGLEMAVDRYGTTGPTVLLLHGIPGWRGTFAEVGRLLGRDHRVIVPDLLGFGASDDAPPKSHAAEQAGYLAEMLASLHPGPVHVVGFDFGGPTAVLLSVALGDRLRSLTLLATNLFPDTPVPGPLRLAKVPLAGRAFFRLAFGRTGLSMLWRFATGDRRRFPFRRYRQALTSQGIRSTRALFFDTMRSLPKLYAPVAHASTALTVPSLVLWGDRDPFFPVAQGRRTAAAVKAEFHVFERCGHFVPEERPEETAQAIKGLVARAESRGPKQQRPGRPG